MTFGTMLKDTIKQEVFGKKIQNKRMFIKEFETQRVEPWINKSEEGFTLTLCDKVLENIHMAQYSSDNRFGPEFYRNLNILLNGCYVAGLIDGKSESDEYVDGKLNELTNKINILF